MARGLTWSGIADDLATRIRAGEFEPGQQLSFKRLMDSYDTSRSTIQRAMSRLQDWSLAEYAPGRGWFVLRPLPRGRPKR